jgi:beta-glucosidase
MWNIAPGEYLVKVGSSSTDMKLQQAVKLGGTAVTKPIREHYFSVCAVK